MLNINCLLNNPQSPELKENLQYFIEVIAGELIKNKKHPSFANLYKEMRSIGLEVDVQTVGELYTDSFSNRNPELYDTIPEVLEQSASAYDAIKSKREAEMRSNEIGRNSPVVAVVASLAKSLQKDFRVKPSIQKAMQESLKKAAVRALNLPKAEAQTIDPFDAVRQALSIEKFHKFRGLGTLDNAEALWADFVREMHELADNMETRDAMGAAQMKAYAQTFADFGYNLLLSNGEIHQTLIEVLRQAGYSKIIGSGSEAREVVDWNKVLTSGQYDIQGTLAEVFTKAGFSKNEVNRIVPFFQHEYEQLVGEKVKQAIDRSYDQKDKKAAAQTTAKEPPEAMESVLKRALDIKERYKDLFRDEKDLLISDGQIRTVISDVLKKAGVAKLSGDKLAVDWQAAESQDFDYTSAMRGVMEGQGFTPDQIDKVLPLFEETFDDLIQNRKVENNKKIASGFRKRTALDKLGQLAAMDAFRGAQRKLVYDVLGISDLTQDQMAAMEGMMKAYNDFSRAGQAAFSPTYLGSLETYYRNTLERTQEKLNKWLMVNRRHALWGQFGSAMLITNPGNITENTLTNAGETAFDLAQLAITNPKQAKRAIKFLGRTMWDVGGGGARIAHEASNPNDARVNFIDRFSEEFRAEEKRSKSGKLMQSAGRWGAILPRVLLNAPDDGFKAFLWQTMEVRMASKVFQAKGLTPGESHATINEAYYGNREELEKIAKQMEDNLRDFNINVTEGKAKRIAEELALGNLATDGAFLKKILLDIEAENKLAPGKKETLKVDTNLLMMIREASINAASRSLGHSQDTWLGQILERATIKWSKDMVERREKNLTRLANKELVHTWMSHLQRFRNATLRYAVLNFYKYSGLGLISTLVYDTLIRERHKLLNPKILKERLDKLTRLEGGKPDRYKEERDRLVLDMERALAWRQRLIRSTIQPMIGYMMLPVLKMAMGSILNRLCNGNDEDCIARKWLYIKEQGWDNLFNKILPIMGINYLSDKIEQLPHSSHYRLNPNAAESFNQYVLRQYNVFAPGRMLEETLLYGKANVKMDPLVDAGIRWWDDHEYDKRHGTNRQGATVGNFAGSLLNLGGPAKLYQGTERYIKSGAGLLSGNEKFSNKRSDSERAEIRAQDPWEGMLRNWLSEDEYIWMLNHVTRGKGDK